MLLDELDSRQQPVAMQAFRVQRVRLVIGRHHELHAVGEEAIEQAIKNHRVGDIGDVELVEADQPVTLRDAPREFVERIGLALEVFQFAMHLAHELVKMQTRLALHRHDRIEAVHQKALAAPDAAPKVHAARRLRMHETS